MSREIKFNKPLEPSPQSSERVVSGDLTLSRGVSPDSKTSSSAIIISVLLHVGVIAALMLFRRPEAPKKTFQKVEVSVVRIMKAPAESTTKPEVPKPEVSRPPKKKPPKPDQVVSAMNQAKPKSTVSPVKGLSKDALAPTGAGPSVPVGNTLMVGDDAKAKAGEEVEALGGEDLSSDASIILSSVIAPEYTADAIDAGLEGKIIVDVMVDATGGVSHAELRKKVGHGMDEKILEAARHARFLPRKDARGRAIEGWTEIKFKLQIPN